MIIFDLDGTLADCEHRRHYIDPEYLDQDYWKLKTRFCAEGYDAYRFKTGEGWQPNYQAYYEACDKDKPIEPVIGIWNDQISLGAMGSHFLWTARCESMRTKTEAWLNKNLLCFNPNQLKMRPVGDDRPDHELFESWLRSCCNHISLDTDTGKEAWRGHNIEMAFIANPAVIAMFRRRGVFVFDVNQG